VFLDELHVANFRAIRQARLSFDATTTLIGENGCGITSLLAALSLALRDDDVSALTPSDRHHPAGAAKADDDVRIQLTFRERVTGEWDQDCHAPLRPHLPPAAGRRRLVLELVPGSSPPGRPRVLTAHVLGVRSEAATRTVVRHLRMMTPVLRIGAGSLTVHGDRPGRAVAAGPAVPGAVAALVRRIVAAADEVLSGTAQHPEACIAAGADAARELLAISPRHIDPARAGLAYPVLEILGLDAERPRPARARGDTGARTGTSVTGTEGLGTLLLLAGILRGMPDGLAPGAEPLWIVEDPEAHLHPMTVASMLGVLGRIRWQKIITTQSGDLLAARPLADVRRLVRHDGVVRVTRVAPRALPREHLRRVGYHLRVHRGVAMFARVWLFVEGESEHWILPQVAQVLGYDLATEGVCCVGFAQCGLEPLVRTARAFGIDWHLLADGDQAGQQYVAQARAWLGGGDIRDHVTGLDAPDIEHCFWRHGHADVIGEVAGLSVNPDPRASARQTISRAVTRRSKPYLALKLVESVAARGPAGVPPPLVAVIETCVRLARAAPAASRS
jgi:putative ATP-dependent endonuclease of OLD family